MKSRNTAAGMILIMLIILIFTGGCGAKKKTSTQPRHQYTTLSELEDKRIGVTTGSVQAIQARERFPDAQLYYYDTTTDMLTALRAGKIDAFADADALVRYILPENPDLTFLDEYLKGGMKVCAIFPKSEKGRELSKAAYHAPCRRMIPDGSTSLPLPSDNTLIPVYLNIGLSTRRKKSFSPAGSRKAVFRPASASQTLFL